MTTNASDNKIMDFVKRRPEVYHLVGDDFDDVGSELAASIRSHLQSTYPFTAAFLGRIGRIVPFLPMANDDPSVEGMMHGESMTVAKLLIERQQETLSSSETAEVHQRMSSKTKHRMAKIVVKEAPPEAGVRGIQSAVEQKMGDRIMNALLLEHGGIENGSHVQYFAEEEARVIDFRVQDLTETADSVMECTRDDEFENALAMFE